MKTNRLFLTLTIAVAAYSSIQADNLPNLWLENTRKTSNADLSTVDEYASKLEDAREGYESVNKDLAQLQTLSDGIAKFRETKELKKNLNGPLKAKIATLSSELKAKVASVQAQKKAIEQSIRQIEASLEKARTRLAQDSKKLKQDYQEITQEIFAEQEKTDKQNAATKEKSEKQQARKQAKKKTDVAEPKNAKMPNAKTPKVSTTTPEYQDAAPDADNQYLDDQHLENQDLDDHNLPSSQDIAARNKALIINDELEAGIGLSKFPLH